MWNGLSAGHAHRRPGARHQPLGRNGPATAVAPAVATVRQLLQRSGDLSGEVLQPRGGHRARALLDRVGGVVARSLAVLKLAAELAALRQPRRHPLCVHFSIVLTRPRGGL